MLRLLGVVLINAQGRWFVLSNAPDGLMVLNNAIKLFGGVEKGCPGSLGGAEKHPEWL